MNRMQSLPRIRIGAPHARNSGAAQVLAQISTERRRLEQERGNWQQRMRRIDLRLREIAAMEARLLANIKPSMAPAIPAPANVPRSSELPRGVTQITMQY